MAKEAKDEGTVKRLKLNDNKGFGYISPNVGGEEVLVHKSSIKTDGVRSLVPGEAVEFDVAGRAKAVGVTGPDGSALQGVQRNGAPAVGGGGNRYCYNCGEPGHMWRDCNK